MRAACPYINCIPWMMHRHIGINNSTPRLRTTHQYGTVSLLASVLPASQSLFSHALIISCMHVCMYVASMPHTCHHCADCCDAPATEPLLVCCLAMLAHTCMLFILLRYYILHDTWYYILLLSLLSCSHDTHERTKVTKVSICTLGTLGPIALFSYGSHSHLCMGLFWNYWKSHIYAHQGGLRIRHDGIYMGFHGFKPNFQPKKSN